MKKTLKQGMLFALITLGIATFTHAQVSVGAKGGLNLSSLSGLDIDNYKSKALLGFHVGGFATFNIVRHFAIQPELLYSSQGGTIENGDFRRDVKLNYFNIPVMFKVLTNSGLYFEAGPQIGFRTGDLDTQDIEGDIKKSDFSMAGGIGFQPTKSAFGLGARYNVGMGKTGNISRDNNFNNADFKNGVFQLSAYWRIFGGGSLKD